MRALTLLLGGLLLFGGQTLTAQQWSAQEQQVLDDLTECWDIWMADIRAGNPDRWLSQCATPELTYWGTADGSPSNNEFLRRNWSMISTQDLGWVDLRPVSLSVQGDIAVLHFYGLWRAPDGDAEVVTEAKRTEVFRRIDNRWKMIAGQATPISLADAAPYRTTDG